jgi:hypothetical protein
MLTAMVSVAALFAIYCVIRPRAGCTHNCGMCARTCGSPENDHD